jgi:hypothetical protein
MILENTKMDLKKIEGRVVFQRTVPDSSDEEVSDFGTLLLRPGFEQRWRNDKVPRVQK